MEKSEKLELITGWTSTDLMQVHSGSSEQH